MRLLVCAPFLLLASTALSAWKGLAEEELPLYEELHKPAGIEQYDPKYGQYLEDKRKSQAAIAKSRRDAREKLEGKLKELDEAQAKLDVPKTDTVTVDEETLAVTEPLTPEQAINRPVVRDLYERSPEDFDMLVHETWSLNKTDFLVDQPEHIVVSGKANDPRQYWGFTFSVVNSTTQPRRIAPLILAVTNKGAFEWEVGGFLPLRLAADSLARPLGGSTAPGDKLLLEGKVAPLESVGSLATQLLGENGVLKSAVPPEPMATFQPGQTRWGMAVWDHFSDDFTELKIVVHGLTNANRYDQKLRRVLVLTFTRQDDEFDVYRTRLEYKGKEFQYVWMWDADLTVPLPTDPKDAQLKDKVITTPAGGQKLLWSFPYQVDNSTATEQALRVKEIRFLLPVPDKDKGMRGIEVDVSGQKAVVEVPIVDDGRSSIYKAQYLRELGLADPARDPNRFAPDLSKVRDPGGLVYHVDSGKRIEGRAVFDAADVDWNDVRMQIEVQLSQALDRKALTEKEWAGLTAKDPKAPKQAPLPLYNPRRQLTDDVVTLRDGRKFTGEVARDDEQGVVISTVALGKLEFGRGEVEKVEKGEMAKVKEQVLAALPAALEAAKKKKQVVAVFDCEAGLSTGKYRVSRSYRQTGEVKEEWLKAWEEFLK